MTEPRKKPFDIWHLLICENESAIPSVIMLLTNGQIPNDKCQMSNGFSAPIFAEGPPLRSGF